MTQVPLMPAPFAELAPMAVRWARPTENERNTIRWASSAGDFAAMYAALNPRLPEILAFLASQQPKAMTEDVRNLYLLTCAFAEAAPHHELYGGSPNVPHSFDARRFVPVHGNISA